MCFGWPSSRYLKHYGPDRPGNDPPLNYFPGRSGASNPHSGQMPFHQLNPDWDPQDPYAYPKFVREQRGGYQPVQGMQAQPPSHQAGGRTASHASAGSVFGGGGGIDPWGRGRSVTQTSNRNEAGRSRGMETNHSRRSGNNPSMRSGVSNSRRSGNNPSMRSGANNSRRSGTDAFMGPPNHGARSSAMHSAMQAGRFQPGSFATQSQMQRRS